MTDHAVLFNQIRQAKWRPMLYGVYNILDDDGWTKELQRATGERPCVEDLEFATLNIGMEDVSALRNGNDDVMSHYRKLRRAVEDSKYAPYLGIGIKASAGAVFAARLKDYDVSGIGV